MKNTAKSLQENYIELELIFSQKKQSSRKEKFYLKKLNSTSQKYKLKEKFNNN